MDHTSRKQTFETFAEPTHMSSTHCCSARLLSAARTHTRARMEADTHTHTLHKQDTAIEALSCSPTRLKPQSE